MEFWTEIHVECFAAAANQSEKMMKRLGLCDLIYAVLSALFVVSSSIE